jgi:hypothetical protein
MQTRKRAKSITFGKKKKEDTEEVETPVVEPTEPVAETPETTEEKAETVERRSLTDKPQSSELSATLPSTTEEDETPKTAETPAAAEPTATPSNEFITDNEPSVPAETTPSEEETKSTEPETTSAVEEPKLETSLSPETPAPTAAGQELSPTSPETPVENSAFTIQNDEKATAPEVVGEGGKKRFGLYFFLVAFLAFILGLGAMAVVSYGGVNIPFLSSIKIPTNVQMPAIPGVNKPTPTAAPTTVPTVAPTAAAADLKAYTISVLNGSGVVGKAADVKTSLTTDGFKVGTTGNADKSDYTKTQIAAKKSVDKAYLTKLEEELKKSFDVAAVSTAPDSQSADVTVTIGASAAK